MHIALVGAVHQGYAIVIRLYEQISGRAKRETFKWDFQVDSREHFQIVANFNFFYFYLSFRLDNFSG